MNSLRIELGNRTYTVEVEPGDSLPYTVRFESPEGEAGWDEQQLSFDTLERLVSALAPQLKATMDEVLHTREQGFKNRYSIRFG